MFKVYTALRVHVLKPFPEAFLKEGGIGVTKQRFHSKSTLPVGKMGNTGKTCGILNWKCSRTACGSGECVWGGWWGGGGETGKTTNYRGYKRLEEKWRKEKTISR